MKQLPAAFASRMKRLLGNEFDAFMASFDQPAERAFRVNTDKIRLADFAAANTLDSQPIPYVPTGYYFRGEKIGHHPFHHAGMVYAQDPGAMATAECLDIDPDWWVLDLCAAPGGKTSQLKNKLGENGMLISNEIIPSRCKILTGNVERLGFTHMATTCLDPARVAALFPQTFDLIMVDAPCSGEGMFRKDDTAIAEWSEENVARCAARQKEILDQAVTALRPGGYLIYATCTFSLEENEMVVDHLLSKYSYFSLEPVNEAVRAHTDDGIAFDGCHCQNLSDARRFYPHRSRGEGQFMAVLHDTRPSLPRAIPARPSMKPDPIVVEFLKDTLSAFDPTQLTVYNGKPVYAPPALPMRDGAFSYGITVGEVKKNYLLPHHQFFMALGAQFKRKIELSPDDPRLERYLHGEEIEADCENGWAVVTTLGCAVGGVKVSGGRAKNHYPKGLRKLK
jgi:NOL1/NOP2/sun family putative RNA methylase